MGVELLEIPRFSQSIGRCTEALKVYIDLDVADMLNANDSNSNNSANVQHGLVQSFVGIVSIQVWVSFFSHRLLLNTIFEGHSALNCCSAVFQRK